ncbi:MAG TPA: chemotaxis protein CheD [Planctomycetaceae bacterium]|nr:chemotaxis protein CheD [Planctomycetaceae bacterium]
MGQIAVIAAPDVGRTVLGSCIGLVLYDPPSKIGAMAHIVLAEKQNRPGPPGKFADTAVPHMLELLAARGAARRRLIAKVAGGSAMFSGTGPIQIGEANYRSVMRLLKDEKIRIAGEDIGGPKGRRITFDAETGRLVVEIVGQDPLVL